jgi:hypothetical protein
MKAGGSMKRTDNERGSAILLALALIVMFSGIGLMVLNRANTDSDLSFNQVHYDQAFWLADAGAERAIAILSDSADWRAGYAKTALGDGYYTVSVTDSSTDTSLDDRVRVISLGERGAAAGGVEVIMGPAGHHPLYDHAIYAGNYWEHETKPDSADYVDTMKFSGTGTSGDIINGDVFFNGNIKTSGNATINGSAEAGGDYTGTAPAGGSTSNASYLEPPNLQAMNYESIANYKVNSSSPWDGSGRIASTDPRHIFVRNYRTDLKPPGVSGSTYTFSNTNYFWGDPWEGAGLDEVSVSGAGNNKVYFVDGNLWVEPNGTTSRLINSPPEGTHITVIVKGNVYFSDDLMYDRPTVDGIAFVAMTDGESYDDKDNDGRFDAGEAILHDDGDGIYEGPAEGSGNVCFGDPNGGPLGHVHAFLYADNDFKDYVLDPSGSPLGFEITGTMSAGNDLDIRRDFAGGHAQMKVNHDTRIRDGVLNLPGLPSGGNAGVGGLVVLAWREL